MCLACSSPQACSSGLCEVPASCGVCPAGTVCQGTTCVSAQVPTVTDVSLPALEDRKDGTKVLLTYVSHLIGTSSALPALAEVTLHNPTSSPVTVQLTVDVPSYASPTSQPITLAAGETKKVRASPPLDTAKLFANTSVLPAAVSVELHQGSTSLFGRTYPFQILGKGSVIWTNAAGRSLIPLTATMVTPQDKHGELGKVISAAAKRTPTGAILGYQEAWATSTFEVVDETYNWEVLNITATDPKITVRIDSVDDTTLRVFIMSEAEFGNWKSGREATTCMQVLGAKKGSLLECPRPAAGSWYVVYYNPNLFMNINVSRTLRLAHVDNTRSQMRALYEELHARGMAYVSLGGSGFVEAQNVRYPYESLTQNGANCIDGSLLYASLWEAMGFQPLVVTSLRGGHAVAAVRCWANDTSCAVGFDSVLTGTPDAFDRAVEVGAKNIQDWQSKKASTGDPLWVDIVDIPAMRSMGFTPAPM